MAQARSADAACSDGTRASAIIKGVAQVEGKQWLDISMEVSNPACDTSAVGQAITLSASDGGFSKVSDRFGDLPVRPS